MDLEAMTASVRSTLKTYGHARLELEFRLGHLVPGNKFVPGVQEATWTTLKAALDASPAFRVVESTTDERIQANGSKYVIPSSGEPHWIHKRRLVDFDGQTNTTWACRTSVSLEETGPGPAPTSCTFRRQKMRWSYLHKCWSLDLTRVVSNLPHQLDNDQESFEVEIELRDTTELFARRVEHILEWGHTIASELCGLMT